MRSVALSVIDKFGLKGSATLVNKTQVVDGASLKVTESTVTLTPLLAYVGRNPSSKTDNTDSRRTNLRVLAAIDSDFDGTVNVNSKMVVDGRTLDVESYTQHKVNGQIAYVEFITVG